MATQTNFAGPKQSGAEAVSPSRPTVIDIEKLPLSISVIDLAFEMENKKAVFDPVFKPHQHQVILFIQKESL